MTFALPRFQRRDVNRAGLILAWNELHGFRDYRDEMADMAERLWAHRVLSNWRACHGYPINTFQATLRLKLKTIDKNAIVAQRLKRAPSVIAKLQRFPTMKLTQMQDIGGLRAVVSSVARVRRLEANYRESAFKHELASSKDYIDKPKSDGYRSIHLVFRYANDRAPRITARTTVSDSPSARVGHCRRDYGYFPWAGIEIGSGRAPLARVL